MADLSPLLDDDEGGGGRRRSWWVVDVEEAKAQTIYALPMIFTNLFFYCIPLTSVMFASHLGQLELAGATLANSWATVTGFAFMTGLSGALETLCGQGFGAKSYRMLGIHLQSSCIVSLLFTILITLLWFFTESAFGILRQDPSISKQAALYIKYQAPGLLAYAFLQNILRFCQTQSVVTPLLVFSLVPLLINIGLAYLLVDLAGLGFIGAPIATSISLWIAFLSLGIYVIRSHKFEQTWTGFSSQSFRYLVINLTLSIPSAAMVCLEYWAFEILVFLAGLMPNPEITTSLVAICVNTESISYMLTYGLSAAASTRVSNELGAGNVRGAKKATCVTVKLSLALALGVVLVVLVGHDAWVGLFSNSIVIKEEFASLRFFLAASITLDSIQGVLSGKILSWIIHQSQRILIFVFIYRNGKRLRMAACSHHHKLGNILLNWNANCSLFWFQVEVLCQGSVVWFDMWDILPILISLSYGNFPEVGKAECLGLKLVPGTFLFYGIKSFKEIFHILLRRLIVDEIKSSKLKYTVPF